MDVQVAVLGPLELTLDDAPVALERAAWRRLVLLLAVTRGEVVPDDRLVDALWPDGGGSLATLRTYVSHVRRHLGAEVVDRRGPGYRLAVPADHLDAAVFERTLAEAGRHLAEGDPAAAVTALDDGLARWRGPAFVEVADLPFARPEARRLDELRLDAEELRLAAALELDPAADHTAAARSLADAHPLRERRWELVLRALAAVGRQQEALTAYREVRDRLVDELGVEPGPALRAVHDRVLRQDLPTGMPAGLRRRPTGAALPAATDRFVGRETLLHEVAGHLDDRRLVTLVGPGGSGKTRLLHELLRRRATHLAPAASAVVGESPATGDAHLVDLTQLRDPDRVPDQVAAALGARPRPTETVLDAVVGHLGAGPTLLAVDNAEHLRDAVAAVVEQLLEALPELTVLVTSRAALDVAGEQRVPVPPLALPPSMDEAHGAAGDGGHAPTPDPAGLAAVAASEAVELFTDRARAADPSFVLDATTAPAVAGLCRRLDGMPLALELAAARVAHLDVGQLADRLEERLDLLTRRRGTDRHRSLRATLDWSHDLLGDDERRLWRRLGAFAGSFGLAAVRAVATVTGEGGAAVADPDLVLAALVDQSLVVPDRDGAARDRFRLLETLRADAARRLAEAGETDVVLERLTHHLVDWAERYAPTDVWPEDAASVAAARVEHPNLRVAVDWALRAGRHDLVLRLGGGLISLWHAGGQTEPRAWLDTALAAVDAAECERDVDEVVVARALQSAAWLAGGQSDYPRAVELAGRALALAERQGDDRRVAWALDVLGNAAWNTGRWDEALAHYERSLTIWERLADRHEVASLLQCIGAVAYRRGDYARAGALLDRAVGTFRDAGVEVPGWVHYDRGILADRLGRHAEARHHLEAALADARTSREPTSIASCLRDLARVAVDEGHLDDAATWCDESLHLHRRVRDRWGEAATLTVLARACLLAGDRTQAATHAAASRRTFLDLGDDWGVAGAEVVLGRALAAEDPPAAHDTLRAAEARATRLGDPWLQAEALEALVEVLPPDAAVRAAADADELRDRIGAPVPPSERADHARRRSPRH